MGGGEPEGPSVGGEDSSLEYAKREDARKQKLRDQINRMYGIGGQTPVYGAQTTREVDEPATWVEDPSLGFEGQGGGYFKPAGKRVETVMGEPTGYQDDPEAAGATAAMDRENTALADATRGYYTDQLGRTYTKAERQNRFALARKGLLGGSADVDTNAELRSDRDLGATRIDQAVRGAVNNLVGQRESERQQAIALVNSGAGEDAITSASRGLSNALNTAQAADKRELFGDLFQGVADGINSANALSAQNALLARYQDKLGAFFPQSGRVSAGRITATS